MDKPRINLIIFDMGHVFIDFNWEDVINCFKKLKPNHTIDFIEIMNYLSSLGYEAGKIDTAEFLASLNQKAGLNLSLEEFTLIWNYSFAENIEMAELMSQLKQKLPLYLLSNTNENHFTYLENTFKVSRHFDELVLSYEVGYVKPEPEIYLETLKRANHPAQNCLFIDDLPQNIEAARQLGINTILFEGCQKLKDSLAEYNLNAV